GSLVLHSAEATLTSVDADDGQGSLHFAPDNGVGDAPDRRWSPSRAVSGTVTLRYTVPVATFNTGSNNLEAEAAGVMGAGANFILLPTEPEQYRVSIKWDLAQLPAQSRAMSSLGAGDIPATGMPVERLARCFFAAGKIQIYERTVHGSQFMAAWYGV